MLRKLLRKVLTEYRWLKSYKWGTIWNYLHGFFPSTVSVCKIDKKNYNEFLNDRDYFSGHPWNGAYSSIIDNKLYLPLLLKNYPEVIPTYYYFKDESGFLSLCDFQGGRNTIDDFFNLLSEKKKLCLKHTHSSVGQGFMLVEKSNDVYYLNGMKTDFEFLKQKIENLNEYIVCEHIKGHAYSTRICSTSLNTIT